MGTQRRLTNKDHQEISEASAIWNHGRRKGFLTKLIADLVSAGMENDNDGIKVLQKLRNRRKDLDLINPLEK